jgi:parallel beta-helix repeat protein
VSLRDIVVKGFDVGISFLEGVSNNSILESVIADNHVGLEFDKSYGTVVSGNTIQNNSQGILFSYMWSGANVSNNIIIGNDRGISFNPYGGGEAIISRNRIERNNIGIESRLSSNIISGNSIRDCDTGIELCGNPSLIERNEIINNTIGLNMIYGTDHYGEIYASNRSVITRNTFHGNMKGVYFHGSSYNNMTDNVIVGNGLGVAF